MRFAAVLICVLCLGSFAAVAQETGTATVSETGTGQATEKARSRLVFPVLVFDRARVLTQSAAGKALEERIEAAHTALLEENTRIYDELEAEEQELADIRNSLSEEVFRPRAQAFDEKVEALRAEQDRKGQAIQAQYDEGLTSLEEEINTVLASIAREYGALLVFERGQVYLLSGAIDVSGMLIERLDARMNVSEETDSATGTGSDSDAPAAETATPQQD
ncbi:OmpH family outer membrane protein [Celeribacter persicus]|uniref:Periplasmic chaperone for outer membrane proteins Skp n=1 Tax=Celeribacter persicus TaxID=1651082 RepID=A0A2T5H903_9RHOB|nr:OmpH family outer membrane protein [Celeribacter persicus]PTQ68012.1 periplasmic chaperone for outer membrane proteins Skp [Celeribacter persicus]